MSNIFDYLQWRGDLSFADVKLCEVDGIIFSMMSYIDYEAISAEGKLLRDAAEGYCADGKYESVNLGLIMPSRQINRMFCLAAKTKRYGNVRFGDFVSRLSDSEGYQFCAMTFHLPGKRMAVVYRGTDDTIAGYREDCCLSFLDEVPAQRMALEYIENIAAKYPDEKIYIAGHSKGGNLSLYAAAKSSEEIQNRIVRVFCNDGPGLSRSLVASEGFKRVQRKLTVLIPQSSFIGIMFEKGESYTVIKSTGKALFQHDPYSWELEGPAFVKLPELSRWGKRNEEQFRQSMDEMTLEEKEEFVETVFNVISSTGAKTLSDFTDGGLTKLLTFIKSYSGLDKQKRELIITLLLKLFDLKREKKNEES